MHHRSGSWVKGHYRNGTWIAGHNRKGTHVSDYTKNSYSKHVLKRVNTAPEVLHMSKEEEINRDKNIYILTALEREKNRIKPPVYETYFKGTFAEELAYNRSYRLWSISRNSVTIAQKYLARVIGKDKAQSLRNQLDEQYTKYFFKHKRIPFANRDEDNLGEKTLKEQNDERIAYSYIKKDAKRVLVNLDLIYKEYYTHVFKDWEKKLASTANDIQDVRRTKRRT